MKKVHIIILLISSQTLSAWFPYYYQYSDFIWKDNNILHVNRQESSEGMGLFLSDIISVNTDSQWRTLLSPIINGYCLNDENQIIYVYTNFEILMFDFSADSDNPEMATIFNLNSESIDKIINISWVYGTILEITTYEYGWSEYKKIIFDYSSGKIINNSVLTNISSIKSYSSRNIRMSDYHDYINEELFFIQLISNKHLNLALGNFNSIIKKKQNVTIDRYLNRYFRILTGPYKTSEDAVDALELLRNDQWDDSFIKTIEVYEIIPLDIRFNSFNLWVKQSELYTPLFKGVYPIRPVTVLGERFIFLRNGSLWSYNSETWIITRLSLNNNEPDDFLLYPYYSAKSASTGNYRSERESSFSLDYFNNYMDKENLDIVPPINREIIIKDSDKTLKINIYQTSNGIWSNELFLLNNNEEISLLRNINNW